MEIRSFSGTHPWHPTVLLDTDAHEAGTADEIIENITSGRCPRCERPLPTLPEFPAGSRATLCRSIPICGRCGSDEIYEACELGSFSGAGCWPLAASEIEQRRTRFETKAEVAILAGSTLITEDGAVPIVNPRNTGGWAQFGFRS
jgi:hypothetical protein